MNPDEITRARREALRRAAELELRWQEAVAQRQRATELFAAPGPRQRDRAEATEDT